MVDGLYMDYMDNWWWLNSTQWATYQHTNTRDSGTTCGGHLTTWRHRTMTSSAGREAWLDTGMMAAGAGSQVGRVGCWRRRIAVSWALDVRQPSLPPAVPDLQGGRRRRRAWTAACVWVVRRSTTSRRPPAACARCRRREDLHPPYSGSTPTKQNGSVVCVAYAPFTRWSWFDERSTSWLDELAIWSFEWCNIANIHEAARRALVERS